MRELCGLGAMKIDVVSYSLVACKGCYWQLTMSYMRYRLSKDKKIGTIVQLNLAEQKVPNNNANNGMPTKGRGYTGI